MSFRTLLDHFVGKRAAVIGDLMLDEYVFGAATRISPEAPVMVVRQSGTRNVPGGAANVALNLAALGAEVVIGGVVGDDAYADTLCRAIRNSGIHDSAILRDPSRVTTRKTRVLADSAHQVLRIDHEDESPITSQVEDELLGVLSGWLDGLDVLVLSDYLKGTLTARLAEQAIHLCSRRNVPVVVNPKPKSCAYYAGATLLSLNKSEASAMLSFDKVGSEFDALVAADEIRIRTSAKSVLITLGEQGMAISEPTSKFLIAAPKVEVFDTAGAGDTVVASVALGVAVAGFDRAVFELAAQAGAKVVRHVGVAVPSWEDLEAIRNLSSSSLQEVS